MTVHMYTNNQLKPTRAAETMDTIIFNEHVKVN